jgi:predicted metal-dependent HD superfamily phosphohydrolase
MNDIVQQAEKFVESLLRPIWHDHFYHNYSHAQEVMQRAIDLGKQENIWEEELEILALAWIFHDTGFVVSYDENEPIGAEIASNYLKTISYDTHKIEKIVALIMATDPDYKNPKNILEKIIKDADLDNLGTDQFMKKWELLREELKLVNHLEIDEHTWHNSALKLIQNHTLYSHSQQQERQNTLNANITQLEKLIQNENKHYIDIEL